MSVIESLYRQQQLQALHRACLAGSHILHKNGILDAYGHLSVRHPSNPNLFILPRNMAPATISSSRDLVEYHVADATAVESAAPPGYIERYIHSERYKKYPAVNSVIHSHSTAVIPYTISGVSLRPCFHMAGFLGNPMPLHDISNHYQPGELHDMLIRNTKLGESLASSFSGTASLEDVPDHNVVLMRGHGFTVVASSLEECVYRAIYTKENALIQTVSLTLNRGVETGMGLQYLGDDEVAAIKGRTDGSWPRAWALWVREVEADGLYVKYS